MKYAWKGKLRRVILLAAILGPAGWEAQAPAQTEARRYLVLTVSVPFQFMAGQRTFNPGQYKFVILGPGLLGVLNTKTRQAVHLVTRDLQLAEAPANTHLVFKDEGRVHRLSSILLMDRAQSREVLGEEISVGQNPLQPDPLIPLELYPRGKLTLRAP